MAIFLLPRVAREKSTYAINDLSVPASDEKRLYVTFEGTYDSDWGSDLPINDGVAFPIDDLPGA